MLRSGESQRADIRSRIHSLALAATNQTLFPGLRPTTKLDLLLRCARKISARGVGQPPACGDAVRERNAVPDMAADEKSAILRFGPGHQFEDRS